MPYASYMRDNGAFSFAGTTNYSESTDLTTAAHLCVYHLHQQDFIFSGITPLAAHRKSFLLTFCHHFESSSAFAILFIQCKGY